MASPSAALRRADTFSSTPIAPRQLSMCSTTRLGASPSVVAVASVSMMPSIAPPLKHPPTTPRPSHGCSPLSVSVLLSPHPSPKPRPRRAVVVDSFDLNGPFSSKVLQPDVIYLHQDGASEDSVLYLAARGPEPISAVKPTNFFPDALPGIFKLHLKDCVAPAYLTAGLEIAPGHVRPYVP